MTKSTEDNARRAAVMDGNLVVSVEACPVPEQGNLRMQTRLNPQTLISCASERLFFFCSRAPSL